MSAYYRFFLHLRVALTPAPRPVHVFVVEIKLHFLSLHRKDPSAFFSFPVTDFIAPGYSMIIKHPMDFSTMREKIKNNDYQSIEELKVTTAVCARWRGRQGLGYNLHVSPQSRGRLRQLGGNLRVRCSSSF